MSRTVLTIVLFLLTTVSVCGQCGFCKSYKDFLEDKWEPLDTVYSKSNSKTKKIMWGSSDYKLTTGDKATDKILKNVAFAVMQGNTIYINCYNLKFGKTRFGNGYSKAARIGENDLLFVNALVVQHEQAEMAGAAGAFGGIVGAYGGLAAAAAVGGVVGGVGGSVATSKRIKNPVCYIITFGANGKGCYDIKSFGDQMMDKMLLSRDLIDLHNAYYEEKDKNKRRLAARILPILMEAGIIEKEE